MPHPDDGLHSVADRLEASISALVERQCAALRAFASYRHVSDEDLLRSCERNVVRVVETIRGKAQLPAWVLEDERASGRRRALQGIPSDDVVAAYRATLGVLRDAFLDEAASAHIPLESVILGTRRLWEMTDRYSSELVSARLQVDLDLARRQERGRLAFLHNVLTGTLQPDELREGGSGFGITAAHSYWVLRGRPMGQDQTPEKCLSALERKTASSPSPLLGLIGGDIAGVLRERPPAIDGDVVLAVEGPVLMADLSAAFAESSQMLETAVAFDLRGVVDRRTLSIRAAVSEQSRLSESLFQRYVAVVQQQHGAPEVLLDSIGAYLGNSRSIPATARALSVHVNTLRYRLERYRDLTGADLGDTLTAFEVWWGLQYQLIRKTPATSSPAEDSGQRS